MDNIQNEQFLIPLEQVKDILGEGSCVQQLYGRRPDLFKQLPDGVNTDAIVSKQQIADTKHQNIFHCFLTMQRIVPHRRNKGKSDAISAGVTLFLAAGSQSLSQDTGKVNMLLESNRKLFRLLSM